jgi:membrane-associated phospholipid phosphatase
LVANLIFKENWGRARPLAVSEFGGKATFTPVLTPTDQCASNCSFVSGDGSAGFWFLAFGLLAPAAARIWAIPLSLCMGLLFGGNRIIQGAHFLSDVLFSGFIVGGIVWLLHRLMVEPQGWAKMAATVEGWLQSPFAQRVRRQPLRWALGVGLTVAIVGVMLFVDRPVAIIVEEAGGRFRRFFSTLSQLGVGTGWLIGGALAWLGCRVIAALSLSLESERLWRSRAWAGAYAFCACAGAGLLNNLLKVIAGRPRPKIFYRDGQHSFDFFRFQADFLSFPSGHTAMAFAVATVATVLLPRHIAAYYLLAVMVGASRVLGGAHWVSDVIAGAFVGVAGALAMRHLFEKAGVGPQAALAGTASFRVNGWKGLKWRRQDTQRP